MKVNSKVTGSVVMALVVFIIGFIGHDTSEAYGLFDENRISLVFNTGTSFTQGRNTDELGVGITQKHGFITTDDFAVEIPVAGGFYVVPSLGISYYKQEVTFPYNEDGDIYKMKGTWSNTDIVLAVTPLYKLALESSRVSPFGGVKLGFNYFKSGEIDGERIDTYSNEVSKGKVNPADVWKDKGSSMGLVLGIVGGIDIKISDKISLPITLGYEVRTARAVTNCFTSQVGISFGL
ncbi:MAG: hypothetical protein JXA92_12530 [candidate division Zixibacteria bacterium]|nr:hypothetical protein [candidate division Zixibacteria bacterium]